jgi:hypothetical protein
MFFYHEARPVSDPFRPQDCFRQTVQSDRKVTQPILKSLLMVAVQYSSIGLIHTHNIAVTIQSPRRSPVRQLSFNCQCKDVFFTSATSVCC